MLPIGDDREVTASENDIPFADGLRLSHRFARNTPSIDCGSFPLLGEPCVALLAKTNGPHSTDDHIADSTFPIRRLIGRVGSFVLFVQSCCGQGIVRHSAS
jgi:hypothetical protein